MNFDHFEALGSNCEVGFVLRQLGNTQPSLFRWTAIPVLPLIALLDAQFAGCFDRHSVCPHTSEMVRSVPYDWAFHSALHSQNGEFTAPPARFQRLFEIERARVHNQIAMFTERLRRGGITTIYSSPTITNAEALALLAAIDRFAGIDENKLLVVSADGAVPATVREIAPRCLRASVGWLASYKQADGADYVSWTAIAAQVARP